MLYGINEKGVRIEADIASKDEIYTCPICGNRLLLKRGAVNADHFAHEANACEDDWNYDMSRWHRRMQSCFPENCREVVVAHKGKKHRADVLIGDIVLEFQYSSISAAEFEDRNAFFKNAGYRLAWVFNLSQVAEENIYVSEDNRDVMVWKHPMRIFANADYLGEKNQRFALWFSYHGDEEFEECGMETLERVIWAIKDDYECYSMRRFVTSDNIIVLDGKSQINPNHFFYSSKEFFKEELVKLKNARSFSVKYSGKKGEPKESYICPRDKKHFGIYIWGEYGCAYCRYCYMIAKSEKDDHKMYASYCCYPKPVREWYEDAFDGEYECDCVHVYEI